MANSVVLIGREPLYGVEAEWPFKFVDNALDDGHEVKVFIREDGVWIARNGQKYDGNSNVGEYILSTIKEGAIVRVCGGNIIRRGSTQKDHPPGPTMGKMIEFIEAAPWLCGPY